MYIFDLILTTILLLLPLLIVIAFFTLIERKLMASIQRRQGPSTHGYLGLFQPVIDGIKLLSKEIILPAKSNSNIFFLAPLVMMSLSFTLWTLLPFSFTNVIFDSPFSLLVFFMFSSLNVYSIILSGWASNSKYAFLGAIRAIAQMLSYELILGIIVLVLFTITGSLRLIDIVYHQALGDMFLFSLFPLAIILFIVLLAETNRAPFDLPEAESELVAGYNVEYSSIVFAMFFLGEYCNILTMSTLFVILFLGGWSTFNYTSVIIFIIKILFICFLFIFVRSLLPRYRFDQLILIGWQIFLPLSFSFFCFILTILFLTDALPLLPTAYTFLDADPYVHFKFGEVQIAEMHKFRDFCIENNYKGLFRYDLYHSLLHHWTVHVNFNTPMTYDEKKQLFIEDIWIELYNRGYPRDYCPF